MRMRQRAVCWEAADACVECCNTNNHAHQFPSPPGRAVFGPAPLLRLPSHLQPSPPLRGDPRTNRSTPRHDPAPRWPALAPRTLRRPLRAIRRLCSGL